MDYITTTNLRTQSAKLVETLKKGGEVSLVHRSKVVGIIKPKKVAKAFNAKEFEKVTKDLNLPQTTYEARAKIYRKHMMEKYGKGLS